MKQMDTLITNLLEKPTVKKSFKPVVHARNINQCFNEMMEQINDLFKHTLCYDKMKNCISQYQLEISDILTKTDQLLANVDKGALPLELRKSYKQVLWYLLKRSFTFLEFLRTRHKPHFNEELYIPTVLHPFYLSKVHKRWYMFRTILQRNGVGGDLILLLDDYFLKNAINRPYENIRWCDVGYMETLSKNLTYLKHHPERQMDFQMELVSHLFRCNFNNPAFFAYYIKCMQAKVAKVDTFVQEQREWLDFKSIVSATVVSKDISYDSTLENIKAQLDAYITTQIGHVKKKGKLHKSHLLRKSGRVIHPFYFHVSLTVSQLIFFCRLLMETGVIIVKKRNDFNEFIANHIGTLRKENISIGSIRSKYIKPDRLVVNKVSAVLISMLNLLNAKYKIR